MNGTRNVHTTQPAPKESWKQKFTKHPKLVIGLTGRLSTTHPLFSEITFMIVTSLFILFMGRRHHYRRQVLRDENHPRILFAALVARTFWHIDQNLFASTDFSSFESTMTYFKVCVLVSSWVMQERHANVSSRYYRDIIKAEDIATLRDRDKIEAKFAALLAMPEGQTKALYHSKVRLACMDMHRFFEDFNALSRDEIDVLCNKNIKESTQEERTIVAGIGFGTNMLIRMAWWGCPV